MKSKRNIPAIILCCLLLSCGLHPQGQNITAVTNHDPVSDLFSVKAGGRELFVAKYKDFHYTQQEQQAKSVYTVKCVEAIGEFTISPLSKKINGKLVDANTLEFELAQPSYIVVTINQKRLFLFAESPSITASANTVSVISFGVDGEGKKLSTENIQKAIDQTAAKGQTLVFPAGTYRSGRLGIPSNAKIFLSAGALLKASDDIADLESPTGQKPRGFINLVNAKNVEIKGLGIIDGNGRWLRDKYGDAARLRLLFFSGCENVAIQGITQRDPGSWNTQVMYSQDVSFKNVKQLNDADLANTDGFDPDASARVTIEDCFGYCGDDNVAIKITQKDGPVNSVSDITVRGCVFLTRKSSLKVGTESRGESFRNILFENNDVILSDRGMALYCADGALFENVRYINNRFEDNYPDAKKAGFFFQVSKRNPDSKPGLMKNILVKDCQFFKPFPNASRVEGLDAAHAVELRIQNLSIGGRVVNNKAEARIDVDTFSTINFQ
ncbi:MAG TPA: glycosyl hydrolase family 28 protein [Chitinophagaceae bacterium]